MAENHLMVEHCCAQQHATPRSYTSRRQVSSLASWCFDPNQSQWNISGLETKLNPSPAYSAQKSKNHITLKNPLKKNCLGTNIKQNAQTSRANFFIPHKICLNTNIKQITQTNTNLQMTKTTSYLIQSQNKVIPYLIKKHKVIRYDD